MASTEGSASVEKSADTMLVESSTSVPAAEADEAPAPRPPRPQTSERKRRGSVSAPPMGAISETFACKSYPKSTEVNAWLKDAIGKIFLFSNADEASKDILVAAFFEVRKPANEVLIRQGDDGDNFYFVYSGDCDIFVGQELVMTASATDYFGELALMYHTQRAATVRAATDVVLYGLDQETFNHVLRSSGQGRRKEYDEFLQRVPLLKDLNAVERGKVADVLHVVQHNDEDYIITQGDQDAEVFYILYEGCAVASKADDSGAVSVVMTYEKGDYFGELSLIHCPPRRASVIAKGANVKTACMDRAAFRRLLGSCMPSVPDLRKKYGLPETDLVGAGERCTSPWRRRRGSNDSDGGAGADRERSPAPVRLPPQSSHLGLQAMVIDAPPAGAQAQPPCPAPGQEQVRAKKQRVAV